MAQNGLGAGFIIYVTAHLARRSRGKLNRTICVIALLFVLHFILGAWM